MANLKKLVSYIFSHPPPRNNSIRGTLFTAHSSSSLESLRKSSCSSILEVGTIFAPFHSTSFYNRQKLHRDRPYMRGEVWPPAAVDYIEKIEFFCEEGLIYTAIDYLKEMVGKGFKPPAVTYTMLIDTLVKLKRAEGLDSALKLFREMAFLHGIFPDIYLTYTPLLNAIRILFLSHVTHGNDMISELLKDMKDRRVYVGLATFNILVDAYCKQGRMEDAETLVKLMIQRGKSPDVVTYKWIIDGYCLQGNVSKARQVFDSMRCRGVIPSVALYNTLLNGYIKDSKIQQAMPLFHEMKKNNLLIHNAMGTPNECTYKIVLEALCNNNQVEEAVSLFYSMADSTPDLRIDLYNILIDGASKKGNLPIARNLYNDLLTNKRLIPNAMTYDAMIHVFCKEGLSGEAYEMFLEMKKKSFEPNVEIYYKLLQGFLNNNQRHLAEMCIDELAGRGLTFDATYVEIDGCRQWSFCEPRPKKERLGFYVGFRVLPK